VELRQGDVIANKYEVKERLGSGGMGVVYSALHRELGELVALTFLHASLVAKPDVAKRFLNEARAGMRIKSVHVARVHDLGTHAGAPFIVMEYLTGHSLAEVLAKEETLPLPLAVDLVLQACEAIHEAHALGIIHRDLKPENLFLTDGPDGLKVLDFGISKSSFAEQAALTATHAVIGSPYYMSPEQVTATRSVDARTDVWSLAVILYQVLADAVPFPGRSVMEIHAAIREGAWTPLSEHCDVPSKVDALVTRSLERDREARVPTVLDFATQLAPFGGEVARASLARMQRVEGRRSEAPPADMMTKAPPALLRITPSDTNPSNRRSRMIVLGLMATAPLGAGVFLARGWLAASPMPPAVSATPSASSEAVVPAAVPSGSAAVIAGAPSEAPAPPMALPSAVTAPPPRPAPEKPGCSGRVTPECEAACGAHARGACEALALALVHRDAVGDASRAAALYQTACDTGSMSAYNALGALYGTGHGVSHDDQKAFGLYSKACDGHYARGCVNQGGMYFDGTGVHRDMERGVELFKRGCGAGEPLGCSNAAVAYRTGRGVRQDDREARSYDAKALELGRPRP
jgi:serine/threonine-protein kinase